MGLTSGPKSKNPSLAEQVEAAGEGVSALGKLVGKVGRPAKRVDLPARLMAAYEDSDEQPNVVVVALTGLEFEEAYIEATHWINEVKKLKDWMTQTELGQMLLNLELQVQVLARALRDGNEPTHLKMWMRGPMDVRLNLDNDEIGYLYTQWAAFQAERSAVKPITQEELEKVLAAVKKGSLEHAALNCYDTVSLRTIIIELADQHLKLMMQHSSAIGSASSSSSSSNPDSDSE